MTPVWQNLVIVSGLVAGVVTFLFTTLFIDRFIQRAARRRWAPVTRLALTQMRNQLADAGRGRAGRWPAEPRRLPIPDASHGPDALLVGTEESRSAVVRERTRLSAALVTWWNLLSSVPDSEENIRHTADVALLFDGVLDASWELDDAVRSGNQEAVRVADDLLRARIMACNVSIAGIIEEISARLSSDEVELSEKARLALAALHRRVDSER